MLPRSSSRLTISRIVSTPCSCWVTPRHQVMIVRARVEVELRDLADRRLVDARLALELRPRRLRAQRAGSPRSPAVCSSRNARSIASGPVSAVSKHGLGDAAQEREVAGDPRLDVQRAGRRRTRKRRHPEEVVRDDRAARRRLDERVDVDELRAARVGLGQRGEHPRRVRGGVDADHEDQVGLLPVGEVARCPCRCRATPSAPGRSPRGTCSSSRAGCSCRARAPRAGRGRSPRCSSRPEV